MKRCPSCEFIYEDEQSACDMDGETLVLDTRGTVVPNEVVLEARHTRPAWMKSVMLATVAGIAVLTLVFVGFYGPSQAEPASPMTDAESRTTGTPQPQTIPNDAPVLNDSNASNDESELTSASEVTPSPESANSVRKNHSERITPDRRLTIPRTLPPLPRVSPLPKLSPARIEKRSTSQTSEIRPRSHTAAVDAPKKDSKVRSLLKRTGQLIKKPFKL
jgi:hypothetical protein